MARATATEVDSGPPVSSSSTKCFVQFQHVDGEALQICQRRVPGAEVVDRQLDAERLERPQLRDGHLRLLHDDAFGDLEPAGPAVDA